MLLKQQAFFNKRCIFERRDIAKDIAHCPDTFSSIMDITKLTMTSVGPRVQVTKINVDFWRFLANLDLSAKRSVKIRIWLDISKKSGRLDVYRIQKIRLFITDLRYEMVQ